MIVIDASALVSAALYAQNKDVTQRIATEQMHAPSLIDAEAGNALRRKLVAERTITQADATAALKVIIDAPIERYHHRLLLRSAWRFRDRLPVQDALYVVLAELLDVPLITCDRGQAAAAGERAELFDP